MSHQRKRSGFAYHRKGKHIQKYARSEQEARQKRNDTKAEIKQRRYIALQHGSIRREQRR
jgi:hypothetical protein